MEKNDIWMNVKDIMIRFGSSLKIFAIKQLSVEPGYIKSI